MGMVYRADDLERGQPVALKIAARTENRIAVARFEREAQVLAELHHPNIVSYVAHGKTGDGALWLAMDWLEGCTLATRIRREPLDEAETLAVGRQLCGALAAAHQHGVIHRDLKPSNLFLVDGAVDELRVIDFGLARVASSQARITMSGTLVGTPSFIAPEQACNDVPVDIRADIYSIGAVLFTCMTGSPPFSGRRVLAILTKVLLESPPRVSDLRPEVSSALDELVDRLMAKEPEQRPASLQELSDLLAALSTAAAPESTRAHPRTVSVPALSHRESTFFSVLLAQRAGTAGDERVIDAIRAEAPRFQAQIHNLANNSMVAVFSTDSMPTEMAAAAARCALLVHRAHPEAILVVATGRGTLDDRAPVGDVIDRAAALFRDGDMSLSSYPRYHSGPPSGQMAGPSSGPRSEEIAASGDRRFEVVIDDGTAGLIERRFALRPLFAGAYTLLGEDRRLHATHQLLGQATPCVGRERELGAITALFDECVAESEPRVVLVTGAEGTGKSRLIHELLRRLQERGDAMWCWTAYGDPMLSGSSFGLLGQILRHTLDVAPSDSLEIRRERIRGAVAVRFPASERTRIAAFLGEMIATPFPDDLLIVREAREDPRLMHDQMRNAWEDWVEAVAGERPIICVFDDLHWSDLPSVRYIDAALRNLHDSPLLVVALAGTEIHQRFPDLWRERTPEQIPLRALSRRACRELITHVLSDDVSDAAVEAMAEQCAGNPFYLEEIVRKVVRGEPGELPDTILAMAGRRQRELTREERRVLRAASVFGRQFWFNGVAALVGVSGDGDGGLDDAASASLGAILDRLVAQELIAHHRQSRFPGYQAYTFRHGVFREAVYASFTVEDQERAHLGAGHWLELIGEPEPMVLAEHYRLGSALELAEPWYRQAAEHALDADDLDAVIERVEQAVVCGASGEALGRMRLLQAEAHNWKDEHPRALECGHQAMELLPVASDDWSHSGHQVAWASQALGKVDELEQVAASLVAALPDHPSDGFLASLALCMANLAAVQRTARVEKIRRILSRHLAERTPGRLLAGTVARLHGAIAAFNGQWGDTARFVKEAIAVWNALGNERAACNDEVNLGSSLCQLGEYEESIAVLESCLTRAQRVGANMRVFCDATLAVALARQGRIDEARALFDGLESLETNKYMEAMNCIYRAWFELEQRRMEDAHGLIERAMTGIEHDAHAQVVAFALGVRARIHLAQERSGAALEAAEQGMETLARLGQLSEGEMYLRLAHVEALDACGRRDAAVAALRDANAELGSRAAAISDPGWRESFLDRVAEHRRIRELVATWSDSPR